MPCLILYSLSLKALYEKKFVDNVFYISDFGRYLLALLFSHLSFSAGSECGEKNQWGSELGCVCAHAQVIVCKRRQNE